MVAGDYKTALTDIDGILTKYFKFGKWDQLFSYRPYMDKAIICAKLGDKEGYIENLKIAARKGNTAAKKKLEEMGFPS